MERFYGGCLCYGPPIENGFYYDMFLDGQKWACIITSSVFRHDSSLKISLYTSVVIMERLLFKSVIDGFGLSECSQQFFPSPCQSEENWWWALVMNQVCFLFPGECPALSLGTWRLCVSLWWRKNSRLRGLRSARRHCWRCLRWERTLASSNLHVCMYWIWQLIQGKCSVRSKTIITTGVSVFQYNKFKCRILNEKVTTPTTTVYRWERGNVKE